MVKKAAEGWWRMRFEIADFMFRLASCRQMPFPPPAMSLLPTADLLALDTAGLKSRLSKLRRYL